MRDHTELRHRFSTGIALAICAALILSTKLGATPEAALAEDDKKDEPEKVDIDAQYVKEQLKGYLEPTTVSFKDDNTVELYFDFRERNEAHSDIFLPKVQRDTRHKFRWTVVGEEDWTYRGNSTKKIWLVRGIKMSNDGTALLDCYFLDDVEVEIEMTPFTNYSNGQRTAIVFYTDKHNAIGSNFGDQCAVFKRQKVRKLQGRVDPVPMQSQIKMGLRVRDGKFEALRQGRSTLSLPYRDKDFESGRIGFIWGGNANAVVNYIRITGKIDTATMAKKMRKGKRRR